jgi:methionyl-tRNA formyltransferase
MKVLFATQYEYFDFIKSNLDSGDENQFFFSTPNHPTADYTDYDIGVSFMYMRRIREHELVHPWFNFHPGLLPAYRGRNVCYHAIMNGETEFGATLHYMDKDFDTGDIIATALFPIYNSDTADDLVRQTLSASRDLFVEYLPRIISGEQFPRLPNRGGNYHTKEKIDDFVYLPENIETQIRAITCGDFFPKIDIGGVTYKIVRSE